MFKSIRKHIQGERGMVLAVSLLFLLVLGVIATAAMKSASVSTATFRNTRLADEALYYAEAGVERAKLVISTTNPNLDQVYANNGQLSTLAGEIPYGEGTFQVTVQNNEDDPGFSQNLERDGRYIISSTGRVHGAVKTLEVVVDSFSRFFYFTEWEEAPGTASESDWADRYVFFRDGDTLDGPVHSNHALHISGNPVFTDLASSNEEPFYLSDAADPSDIFLGGTNWSRYVSLPVGPDGIFGNSDDLDEVRSGAQAAGRLYDTYNNPAESPFTGPDPNNMGHSTEFRVHFRGDRGMEADIYKLVVHDPDGVPNSGDEDPGVLDPVLVETLQIGANFNGVIFFHGGGIVHVGGKILNGSLDAAGVDSWVQGRWTLCSALDATDTDEDADGPVTDAGEIQIEGDIKYVDADEGTSYVLDSDGDGEVDSWPANPAGLLGLVSANNVVITDIQAIRDNGVIIMASIMATSGENATFSAETSLVSAVPGDKTINLFGGIIQYRRGVVGRFEMSGGLTEGFRKHYNYDTRLLYMTPPSFPLAVSLKLKSWKE